MGAAQKKMATSLLPRQSKRHRPNTRASVQKCAPFSYRVPVSSLLKTTWQVVVSEFGTSTTHGLTASIISLLRKKHGYNEFSVSAPEPPLLKFAKTFYESPLILLLCGSAVVSALMGNVDDAISISIAVVIVLTGASLNPPYMRLFE